jgi:hypothetical protein
MGFSKQERRMETAEGKEIKGTQLVEEIRLELNSCGMSSDNRSTGQFVMRSSRYPLELSRCHYSVPMIGCLMEAKP